MSKHLKLYRRQGAPFYMEVTSKGAVHPLTANYDAAVLTLRVSDGLAATHTWSTANALALEPTRIRVSLGAGSDTLIPGRYLGQVSLRRTTDSQWIHSDVFPVVIHAEVVVLI